jgi:hypothetical protein
MKKRSPVAKMKSTQGRKPHAHEEATKEAQHMAIDIMERLVDEHGGVADIYDVLVEIGIEHGDERGWLLANQAIDYLLRGGALKIETYCEEHEKPHVFRALAEFPFLPVLKRDDTPLGKFVCIRCGERDYEVLRDENNVIWGFRVRV